MHVLHIYHIIEVWYTIYHTNLFVRVFIINHTSIYTYVKEVARNMGHLFLGNLLQECCRSCLINKCNTQIAYSGNKYRCTTSTSIFAESYSFVCVSLLFDSQVISQLRVLSRSVATGSKFDRELWSNGLSPVLYLWKKLNQVRSFSHFIFLTLLINFSRTEKVLSKNQTSLYYGAFLLPNKQKKTGTTNFILTAS